MNVTMKRKLLYSFFIAAAMSFSGCSSFLEENPVDQMPESEAYKNPEMIYLPMMLSSRQEVVTGTMVDCGEICSLITGV